MHLTTKIEYHKPTKELTLNLRVVDHTLIGKNKNEFM
jgi:hypothetical protein